MKLEDQQLRPELLRGQGNDMSGEARDMSCLGVPHTPRQFCAGKSQLGVDKLMPISWQLFSCLSLCRRCQSQAGGFLVPCSLIGPQPSLPSMVTRVLLSFTHHFPNNLVGSYSLLQGIFPTQESNSGLPHCRQILYQLSHKGSPLKKIMP